jgi:hypothetical protein
MYLFGSLGVCGWYVCIFSVPLYMFSVGFFGRVGLYFFVCIYVSFLSLRPAQR